MTQAAARPVFISHCRGSEGPAALREALAARGIEAFLDEEEIPPGAVFPERLAAAMLGARVIVAFVDPGYLERPWCIYELRVATAPFRDRPGDPLQHLVVALPVGGGDAARVIDRLPPPLAEANLPAADATAALVTLVEQALAACPQALAVRLESSTDDAVRSLRHGALIPAPTLPPAGVTLLDAMPGSLKEGFVGRAELLWLVHDALDPRGRGHAPRALAIEGAGGVGKTRLAAEYVARYARGAWPGGVLWLDAGGGDEHLATQLHAALRLFHPDSPAPAAFGERASDRVAALQHALRMHVPADERGGRLLWVVDDVPEPGTGQGAPPPLSRWCPVRDRVALLCTSRRTGIRDADAHLRVRELALEAAVTLLTRAPVEASWLEPDQWRRVARWLGCWPLGLRIAHASLADGYASADDLYRSARGAEPARALDAEVEVLREDVVADYVQGVAEILHRGYRALGRHPAAMRGLHRMARLARLPLPEPVLDGLLPARVRGLLAKRSWIEPQAGTGPGGSRSYGMHRIIASYLRCVSDEGGARGEVCDPDAELADLCRWLGALLAAAPSAGLADAELTRHLRVVADGVMRRAAAGQASPALLAAARELSLGGATWHLDDFERRPLRFYAARLGEAVGSDESVSMRLRQALVGSRGNGESVARSCVAAAGGMAGSEHAARLLLDALADPRPAVRRQVPPTVSQSRRADVLALPLMQALMQRAGEWNENLAIQLEPLLEAAGTAAGLVAYLLEVLAGGDLLQRRFAAQVLGRMLQVNAALADQSLQALGQRLFDAALHDPAVAVACAASESLAAHGEAALSPLRAQLTAREEIGETLWCRIVDVYVSIVLAAERPPPPRFERFVDDGEDTLIMHGWPRLRRRPELLAPLARFAVQCGDPAARDYLGRVLLGELFGEALPAEFTATYLIRGGHDCWLGRTVVDAAPADSGRLALAEAMNDAIDAGRAPAVLPLAELAVARVPALSSGWWWRGRIHAAMGRHEAAIGDFDRVIALSERFAAAFAERGLARHALGRTAPGLADLDRAVALEPDDGSWRYHRAELRFDAGDSAGALEDAALAAARLADWAPAHTLHAAILGDQQRWEECAAAATRAVEQGDAAMPVRYYRAVAFANLGRREEALGDLDAAIAAAPHLKHLKDLRTQLAAAR